MMDINRQKGELFLLVLILFPLSLNHMLHLVQPVLFFTKFGCGSWVGYQRFA